MTRRIVPLLLGLLVVVAGLAVIPRADAELPPLPPLPAPPAEGSVVSDVLGPLATDYCDTVATVYALAGPLASAQLPPELRDVVDQVTPYLSVVTYACGLVASAPTDTVCASDDQVAEQFGVLGLPLAAPTPARILFTTAAGIEHVFLRAGIDLDVGVARQLALVLGCGATPAADDPLAAAAPVPPVPSAGPAPSDGLGFASPAARPSLAARPGSPGAVSVDPGLAGSAGSVRYPIDGAATVLLALPLLALVAAGIIGPKVRPGRRARGGPAGGTGGV